MSSQIDPTKPADGVPAVKSDLRGNLAAAKSEIEALQLNKKADGDPINMQDAILTRPEFKDYAETTAAPTISGGTLTLDLEAGNVFEVTLTENIAGLNLVNPPASGKAGSATLIVRQDTAGGRTLSWPSAIKWSGGTPPAVTSAANAIDIYAFITRDGGASWFGMTGGQDFS